MLKSVKKRLKDVQDDLFSMIDKNMILIGHSLNSDLHKLQIIHERCIDTAMLYVEYDRRFQRPYLVSLKKLTKQHFNREIQKGR
eukprot:UN09507